MRGTLKHNWRWGRGLVWGWLLLLTLQIGLGVASCTSIECAVQNKVETKYAVPDTLNDTLTIRSRRANGTDTLLLNRKARPTSFALPISYQNPVDTLLFETKKLKVVDTVWISKTSQPHFESVDCGVGYFHHISSVTSTHLGIDSIVLTNADVNYDQSKDHFRVYFKKRN